MGTDTNKLTTDFGLLSTDIEEFCTTDCAASFK